ncbi:hypothetical protein OW763_10785 [Clostridium aestuarii]|uniref:DUF4860 domain-containing protein n=1 Tax=Clostridium aestuarii TaxID=338193 RepID=A0ABT4D0Q9_9CLOT|nr:hypothetical protein [Clostridium aestuarii]MCY6484826.1 hypothetical protein [Clostridium aestuarii]
MKKSYIISAICLLLLVIFVRFSFSIIGVNRENLERDARKSQKIDDSWKVSKSVNDNLGTLLFYDEDLTDFTYSIYLNREGFSFGYFFRSGGSSNDILEGVQAFDYGNSIALISINKVNVVRIECVSENNQKQGEIYTVEPGKPFAITIPITDSKMAIKMYDQDKNEIQITTILSCD